MRPLVGCEVRAGEIHCGMGQRGAPIVFENVVIVGETAASWHGIFEDDTATWIPKAELLDGSDELAIGASCTVVIPRWLAEDRGLGR